MKNYLLTLMCAGALQAANAQAFDWAQGAGGALEDEGKAVVVDEAGNTYVTGRFEGAMQFGATTFSNFGGRDLFIAKYGPAGTLLWVQHGGGAGDDEGSGIGVDSLGNVYVLGSFEGTAVIASDTVSSTGGPSDEDVFLAKLDPAGTLLWMQQAGGAGDMDAYGLSVSPSGGCYVAGHFMGSAAFAGITLTSTGSSDVFLARFDPSGVPLWVRQAGGPGLDEAVGIAVGPQQQVAITGTFSSQMTLGSLSLTGGASSAFMAMYNSSGAEQWARAASASFVEVGGVAIDFAGNSYLTGDFLGMAQFDTVSLVSAGQEDFFLAAYGPAGSLLWAQRGGGIDGDEGGAVTTGLDGRIYVTGSFEGLVTFDTLTINSNADEELFVACFNYDGSLAWIVRAQGDDSMDGNSISINSLGHIAITGTNRGNATIGSQTISSLSPGDDDMLVARLSTPMLATRTLPVSSVPAGGTLQVPFTAAGGFSAGNIFRAQLSSASGSFANPTEIGTLSGTTSGVIQATIPSILSAGSNYRVRVVSTSPVLIGADSRIDLTITTITGLSLASGFQKASLYPNPSSGLVTIVPAIANEPLQLTVLDLTCRVVSRLQSKAGSAARFDLSHLNTGLYLVQISQKGIVETHKLHLHR